MPWQCLENVGHLLDRLHDHAHQKGSWSPRCGRRKRVEGDGKPERGSRGGGTARGARGEACAWNASSRGGHSGERLQVRACSERRILPSPGRQVTSGVTTESYAPDHGERPGGAKRQDESGPQERRPRHAGPPSSLLSSTVAATRRRARGGKRDRRPSVGRLGAVPGGSSRGGSRGRARRAHGRDDRVCGSTARRSSRGRSPARRLGGHDHEDDRGGHAPCLCGCVTSIRS